MCQIETPPFIFYSYISTIILSLITAFSVIYKKMKYSLNRNAFYFILIIALWTVGDLILWIARYSSINQVLYRSSYLIDSFFIFFLYFAYDFAGEKLSQKRKLIFALPLFVTIFSVISGYGIGHMENDTCIYKPGWLIYYSLPFNLIYSIWASVVLIRKYKDPILLYRTKSQIKPLVLAIMFFVLWTIVYEVMNILSEMKKLNIEISSYFVLGNLFFITLIIFNIAECDLFEFKLIARKWFILVVFSIIFFGMFFLSLVPMFYLILLIFYIVTVWVFLKM
ncbi:MAG: hypothetical protein WAV31_04205 [Candidatus Moraniibacteriota bacterium]